MENISNLIVAAAAIVGAIVTALLAGLAIWTFRDIRSRTRDILAQILATVVVAVIPVAGILVYLMLRPRETLAEAYVRALEEESLLASIENQEFCPSCGRRVDADMQFCPSCHAKLRNACPNCDRAVHLSWDLCPYCGGALTPELPVVKKGRRRRLPAQPRTPALEPPQAGDEAVLPAQVAAPHSSFLERVGGAIEGAISRIAGGKAQSRAAEDTSLEAGPPPDDPEPAAPPAARRAAPAGYGQRPANSSRAAPSRDDALE